MTDNNHDRPERTSPWSQRGFVVSAIVVALIVVLGAVLVVTNPSDNDETATQPPEPTTSTTPTSSATTPDDSACGLPAGDQTVPRATPPDTQWELVGTVAVPTAPEAYGPGRVDDGLRSCFAHSPMGALYAASNFIASASDPALRAKAVDNLTAAGEGRDRALTQVEGPQAASANKVQLVGFTVLNYDAGRSTVDLAFRATRRDGTAGLAHMPLSLRWEDGDWKVVLPATGEVFPGVGPIPDLTGYVPWGGA
jgi:hypothetical protein